MALASLASLGWRTRKLDDLGQPKPQLCLSSFLDEGVESPKKLMGVNSSSSFFDILVIERNFARKNSWESIQARVFSISLYSKGRLIEKTHGNAFKLEFFR
jgi:hypothetical protein